MRQTKTNMRNKEEYVSPEAEVFYIILGSTVMGSPFDTKVDKSIDDVDDSDPDITW